MKWLCGAILIIGLAGCTSVPTEQVGGRRVHVTTWDPANVPNGCGPQIKELEWTGQTDLNNLSIDKNPDGSLKLQLGSSLSNTEIAAAMARVAEIEVQTQGKSVGEILNSSVIAQIVGAVLE